MRVLPIVLSLLAGLATGADAQATVTAASGPPARISHIRHIANAIMMMGLMGTVLGLIHALLSIKGTSIGDAAAASTVIGGLIAGMGTALYMSLAALILSLWLNCNFQLLRTATANLAADIIERSRR